MVHWYSLTYVYFLSRQLYQYLVQNRPKVQENVKYVEFGKGYGHKYICNATVLINLIK